eukprot:GEMP01019378.1.p1 GENE.GEMP01019378.1~~GEMP01019378.1.p1  ORF type:complete len:650 (+),score=129.07 GEMP01019378.1:24-1952(+)
MAVPSNNASNDPDVVSSASDVVLSVSGIVPNVSGIVPIDFNVVANASGIAPSASDVVPGLSILGIHALDLVPEVPDLIPSDSGIVPNASDGVLGSSDAGTDARDIVPGVSGVGPGASLGALPAVQVVFLSGDTIAVASCATIHALKVRIASRIGRFAPEVTILDMSTRIQLTDSIYDAPPNEVNAIINDPPRDAAFWTATLVSHAAVPDDDGVARALHRCPARQSPRDAETNSSPAHNGSDIPAAAPYNPYLAHALCAYTQVGNSPLLRTRCVHTLLRARADVNGESLNPTPVVREPSAVVAHAAHRFLGNDDENNPSTVHSPLPFSCVHQACREGHTDVLEVLLREPNVRLDTRDVCGDTPLLAALVEEQRYTAMQILQCSPIRDDVDVNARSDAEGATALMLAIDGNCLDVARQLIHCMADVNVMDDSGNSALHSACCAGLVSIVQLLLNAQANARIHNRYGKTPLHGAASNSDDAIASTDIVTWLCEHGADVNAADNWGYTALCVAARENCPEVCEALLAFRAQPTHVDKYHRSPLFKAAQRGNCNVVRTLLHASAPVDVRERCEPQHTPLFAALWRGHGDVVVALIEAKAALKLGEAGSTIPEIASRAVEAGGCDWERMERCLDFVAEKTHAFKRGTK